MKLGDAYRALGALADEVGSDEPRLLELESTAAALGLSEAQRKELAKRLQRSADASRNVQDAKVQRECARILREVES